MAKVIISCAITGGIHTPVCRRICRSRRRIAKRLDRGGRRRARRSSICNARDPNDGSPTPDRRCSCAFLPVIKQSVDAVINVTTGGGLNMTLDDRLAAPLVAQPEMCSLNMGSMNFTFRRRARVKEWKLRGRSRSGEHRQLHLPTRSRISPHRGSGLARATARGSNSNVTTWAFVQLAYCLDRGIVEPPLFVQSIFGILVAFGAEAAQSACSRRRRGSVCLCSIRLVGVGGGRHQMAFTTMAGINGAMCGSGWSSLYIARASWRRRTPAGGEDPADSGG